MDSILNHGNFRTKGTIEKLKQEQKSPLVKDIIGLGVDMGKILCCYCDWKEGKIKGLPQYKQSMHFTASLLMLEEAICGKLELKEYIDAIAYNYVKEKKGIELERIDTRVVSSITVDKNIPYIAKYGLSKYVIQDNSEIPDNKKIKNVFLHKQFQKMIIK